MRTAAWLNWGNPEIYTHLARAWLGRRNGEEFNGFWHSGGLLYQNSIDQIIKKEPDKIGVVVGSGQSLANAVKEAINNKDALRDKREKISAQLFLTMASVESAQQMLLGVSSQDRSQTLRYWERPYAHIFRILSRIIN